MALERRREGFLPDFFGRRPHWSELFRFPELPEEWGWPISEERIRVEELREDDTLVVRAEMPGIDPDHDVEITVSDGKLEIRAERHEEKKEEEKGRYRSEFRYGAFCRTLPLPTGAREEDVDATYKDGILEVRVPIDEKKAAAMKIQVSRK